MTKQTFSGENINIGDFVVYRNQKIYQIKDIKYGNIHDNQIKHYVTYDGKILSHKKCMLLKNIISLGDIVCLNYTKYEAGYCFETKKYYRKFEKQIIGHFVIIADDTKSKYERRGSVYTSLFKMINVENNNIICNIQLIQYSVDSTFRCAATLEGSKYSIDDEMNIVHLKKTENMVVLQLGFNENHIYPSLV